MTGRTKPETIQLDCDDAADVLHVSRGTSEPSFGEEFDDLLVTDFGIYTGTPTGFQLLHVREIGIDKVGTKLKRAHQKLLNQEGKLRSELVKKRDRLLKQAVERAGKQARNLVEA